MCGGNANTDINLTVEKQDAMRIKDIDEWRGKSITKVKLRDESRAAVSADGVRSFRVKLEAAIPANDAAFPEAVQNRIYAKKSSTYQSGMV